MKIGILYTAYNCLETLEESIRPWIEMRKNSVEHFIPIAAVSIPFVEYGQIPVLVDGTPKRLREHLDAGEIDFLFDKPPFLTEAEARNLPLRALLDAGVDYVMLVDGDEVFSNSNINNILRWVSLDPYSVWHAVSYKNYIFDRSHYLQQPFTPPRIFKVQNGTSRLHSFFWDNDVVYEHNKVYSSYKHMSSTVIPSHVAHVKHYTWLNNDKTRAKIEYQHKHFGTCSYNWNNDTGFVEINPSYYSSRGLPLPIILQE